MRVYKNRAYLYSPGKEGFQAVIGGKLFARRAKRDRRDIAAFYRFLRNNQGEGNPELCHRHIVVVTGSEARLRLKNLTS